MRYLTILALVACTTAPGGYESESESEGEVPATSLRGGGSGGVEDDGGESECRGVGRRVPACDAATVVKCGGTAIEPLGCGAQAEWAACPMPNNRPCGWCSYRARAIRDDFMPCADFEDRREIYGIDCWVCTGDRCAEDVFPCAGARCYSDARECPRPPSD